MPEQGHIMWAFRMKLLKMIIESTIVSFILIISLCMCVFVYVHVYMTKQSWTVLHDLLLWKFFTTLYLI